MSEPTPVLLGYVDGFSVAPGETLRCMVSCETEHFTAGLYRLIHGDTNPDGPGWRRVRVPSSIDGTYSGQRQVIASGSYVRIPNTNRLDLSQGFSVQAWVWPTTPRKPGGQAIVGCAAFALGLDDDGRFFLEVGAQRVTAEGEGLARWRWAFVVASLSLHTGEAALYYATAEPGADDALHHTTATFSSEILAQVPHLYLAARRLDAAGRPEGVFNGKLERPTLFGRALGADEVAALRDVKAKQPDGVLAQWDFSNDIAGDAVPDASGNGIHGTTVNTPTRAVTDHTWTGDESRWTAAAEQYAAIHFHDDDLSDARWQPSFELTVPDGLRSGVYAFHLQADGGEEHVPFWVRPPRGTATADIAFLAPTLTYVAYANERLYWNPGYSEKRPRVTPLETEPPDIDRYMAEHRELGLSLYDVHSDGSGCAYSSRLRPILNMRPHYRAWRLHDAPRHFAADLYLIGWLETLGIRCDVITDEDLHVEGKGLLERYRVVLTGSHPEYVTSAMHVATRAYLADGGRLMYLGGNGFYWVTSIDPRNPHVIELRRATTGTRAWESQPGEEYHSTTGELGGLWRRRGQAPQRVLGIGFAAQGWGGAAGYRRLPASFNPRAAFIFDGIGDDEVIGDFGLVLDGAAGDEIDRFDPKLGSPPHALLLATSAGQHSDYYQVTAEDVTITVPGQGGRESPLVRADMVFFETPNGGAVFSVGSINWLGSLGWNRYQNNVSRITENVLRRFIDPRPW